MEKTINLLVIILKLKENINILNEAFQKTLVKG
jgi:hypothetical protein